MTYLAFRYFMQIWYQLLVLIHATVNLNSFRKYVHIFQQWIYFSFCHLPNKSNVASGYGLLCNLPFPSIFMKNISCQYFHITFWLIYALLIIFQKPMALFISTVDETVVADALPIAMPLSDPRHLLNDSSRGLDWWNFKC